MKGIHWVIIVAIIAFTILVGMEMQKEPTLGESLSNAGEQFAESVEEAGEELDPNPTLGERVGDAVEDAGDSIEDASRQ